MLDDIVQRRIVILVREENLLIPYKVYARDCRNAHLLILITTDQYIIQGYS